MKLLCCHVENYGKLQDFDYSFNDGLNIILQANGWGKSTFASFIKAMLFGLPYSTKRSIDENERMRYTPWQNGRFGGWLEFELDGQNYRIERFFGEKAAKDTAVLYDLRTNTPLKDPEFVQKKLGINADTFARSTFIQQGYVAPNDDESIKERLGKLIENQEVESLKDVDEKLLDYQRSLEYIRGKGGKLWQVQHDLDDTITDIENAKLAKAQADALGLEYSANLDKINAITKRIEALRTQQQSANEQLLQNEKLKYFETMKGEVAELEAKRNELVTFFRDEPPSNRQIEELLEMQNSISSMQKTLDTMQESTQNQNIDKLNAYFKNGIPTDTEMAEIKKISENLRETENKLRFSQNIYERTGASKNSTKKYFGISAIVLAVIMIVIGIVAFLSNMPLLVTFIVIGVILGGIGLFLVIKPTKSSNIPAEITSKTNLENLQSDYDRNFEIISNFVTRFNENPQNYIEAIFNIDANRRRLKEYNQDTSTSKAQKDEIERRLKRYKDSLVKFYGQFYPNPNNFSACFNDYSSRARELETLKSFIEQKNKEIATYSQKNNVDGITPTNSLDLTSISSSISEAEREKEKILHDNSAINSQLINASTRSSGLGALMLRKDELETELTKIKGDVEIVKLTREYLGKAKDNLTSKYLTPLTNAFREFSRKIVGENFDKVSIDTTLNVLIEKQGEKKGSKSFSQGGRDVIELCMRLALAKTLFDKETPPIILDDPFSNLDDEKTEKALDMLDEIAKEFQVLYLVCHSSRIQKDA